MLSFSLSETEWASQAFINKFWRLFLHKPSEAVLSLVTLWCRVTQWTFAFCRTLSFAFIIVSVRCIYLPYFLRIHLKSLTLKWPACVVSGLLRILLLLLFSVLSPQVPELVLFSRPFTQTCRSNLDPSLPIHLSQGFQLVVTASNSKLLASCPCCSSVSPLRQNPWNKQHFLIYR